VSVDEVRASRAYLREKFSFPSPYRPWSDVFAPRYDGYTETHTVYGRRYRPFMGHSRATLVFLHGWTEGEYRWEERSLFPWLCKCGYTVVALVHPYHAQRKPAGARFGGEYFISSDLLRTVEACRQAVIDARATLTWLLDEVHNQPVGTVGISLGAFMTYLLLCADERPAFALPIAGHGQLLGDGDNENASLVKNISRGIKEQGLDVERLRPLLRPITALDMRPRISPERILPINGLYDAIISADKAQDLFDAWGIPGAVWLPIGHFGFGYKSFRPALRDFVERWIKNH
jgi:dienelactone hydrolase